MKLHFDYIPTVMLVQQTGCINYQLLNLKRISISMEELQNITWRKKLVEKQYLSQIMFMFF